MRSAYSKYRCLCPCHCQATVKGIAEKCWLCSEGKHIDENGDEYNEREAK